MSPELLSKIFNLLGVLIIIVIIALIWFVIWTAIRYPIKMKDDILKERETARKDLLEIQAAKSVEWDKYKELQAEVDKLRKAYFAEKETVDKLTEEKIKLTIDKENIMKYNNELKKTKDEKKETDKVTEKSSKKS